MSYRRILLKLSGEALMGNQKFGLSPEICRSVAEALVELQKAGVQIAVVIGGGNIFRGIQGVAAGMQRVPSDQIGMLATLINALTLQQALQEVGCRVKVMSALACPGVVETYHWQRATQYLEEGFLVLSAGGTGLPYFTTDTAAALRAVELRADILLKATKVDGVYDKDPVKFPDAKRFESLTLSEMLSRQLLVLDGSATALCRDNRLPLLVFDLFAKDSLKKAVFKQDIGTLVLPQ